MCLAIVGHIQSIQGSKAKVNYNGNILQAELGIVEAKEGDYILIHAGCAIEVLTKAKALELEDLFKELQEAFNE